MDMREAPTMGPYTFRGYYGKQPWFLGGQNLYIFLLPGAHDIWNNGWKHGDGVAGSEFLLGWLDDV